jgi:hypothetical protein
MTTSASVLIDGIVEGVEYSTSSGMTGLTTKDGYFNYVVGDQISFNIGQVSLGTITSDDLVSGKTFLQDIANVERTDLNDEYVENMAVFLQSLDENNDASDGIVITKETREALSDVELDLKSATEQQVKDVIEEVGGSYINEEQAMTHVQEMLIQYGDLTADDFATHHQDTDPIEVETNTDTNNYDRITGLSSSEQLVQGSASESSVITNGADIITDFSPELANQEQNSNINGTLGSTWVNISTSFDQSNSGSNDFELFSEHNGSFTHADDDDFLALVGAESDFNNSDFA